MIDELAQGGLKLLSEKWEYDEKNKEIVRIRKWSKQTL